MNPLILDATTKSIKIKMSGAPATTNPDYTSHWADTTTTTITEGSLDGTLNGATEVVVVTSPGVSTNRVIKEITVTNVDTAAVTIIVEYVSAGGTRLLAKATLQVNDTWTTNGTFDTTGSLKQTLNSRSLSSANLWVGNSSNVETSVTITGDVTISNTGVTTIGTAKVTNAMRANMAANTISGNNTGGSAVPLDLTVAQVNTMLADELTANKNAASGYAGLDSTSRVTMKLLPPAQSTSASSAPIKLTTSASHITTPEIGAVEFLNSILEFTPDATVKRGLVPVSHYYRNNNAVTMPASAVATNIFTAGTVAIVAGTTYEFHIVFRHTNANTTSHTEGTLFTLAGGASVTDFNYRMTKFPDTATISASSSYWGTVATVLVGQAVTTAAPGIFVMDGTFRCNAGGTIAPQFKYSATPGGTGTIAIGAWGWFRPLGLAAADISIGAWV